MGRHSPTLLMTLHKFFVYFKPEHIISNPESQVMSVLYSAVTPRVQMLSFSMEGSSLVSEIDGRKQVHKKIDGNRVATDVLKNDQGMPSYHKFSKRFPKELQSRLRVVDATFFRHLYWKCDICAYFVMTSDDIGALGYKCPHCKRSNSPSSDLYIAQTRQKQAMPTHWHMRSGPTSYLVTDDLQSHPLSKDCKEMCSMSDFVSKRIEQSKDRQLDLELCSVSPAEVVKELGKWEDLVI